MLYLIEGYGKIQIGDEDREIIESGTLVFCPKGINHTIENESKNIMKWCFCFIPPTKIEDHNK